MSGARHVSRHETRHVLAAGCGLVQCGADGEVYGKALVLTHVAADEGEVGLLIDDTTLQTKASRLAAYGPIAKSADPLGLLRSGDVEAWAVAGDLSDEDLKLATAWDGGDTVPMVTIMAVKALEARLGVAGFDHLARIVRDHSNQGIEQPFHLSDLIPREAAQKAVTAASEAVKDALDPPVPADEWKRLSPAQKQGRRSA